MILTGGASFTSSIFPPPIYYTGTGNMLLAGVGYNNFIFTYGPTGISGGIEFGSSAIVVNLGISVHYIGSGGILLTGYAILPVTGSGGCLLSGGGSFVSPSWHYLGVGGMGLGGFQPYLGVGGVVLAGSALIGFNAVGSGNFTLGGSGLFVSADWHYVGVGGIFLAGNGSVISNYYAPIDLWVMTASIPFVEVTFTTDQGSSLVAPVETISTDCGCTSLPLTLLFNSNFGNTNIFSNFLLRNGLTLSANQPLFYNKLFGMWQQNLHIIGVGDDGRTQERWDILFEWGCSNQLAGQDIGQNFWRFQGNFVRKSILTGQMQSSRVMVIMDSLGLCADSGVFRVSFTIDTLSKVVTLQSPANLELQVIYDEIGLFSGPWNVSPTLAIKIGLVPPTLPFTFVDGTPLLLKTPSIFV